MLVTVIKGQRCVDTVEMARELGIDIESKMYRYFLSDVKEYGIKDGVYKHYPYRETNVEEYDIKVDICFIPVKIAKKIIEEWREF
jgi:hypothetical protein